MSGVEFTGYCDICGEADPMDLEICKVCGLVLCGFCLGCDEDGCPYEEPDEE